MYQPIDRDGLTSDARGDKQAAALSALSIHKLPTQLPLAPLLHNNIDFTNLPSSTSLLTHCTACTYLTLLTTAPIWRTQEWTTRISSPICEFARQPQPTAQLPRIILTTTSYDGDDTANDVPTTAVKTEANPQDEADAAAEAANDFLAQQQQQAEQSTEPNEGNGFQQEQSYNQGMDNQQNQYREPEQDNRPLIGSKEDGYVLTSPFVFARA